MAAIWQGCSGGTGRGAWPSHGWHQLVYAQRKPAIKRAIRTTEYIPQIEQQTAEKEVIPGRAIRRLRTLGCVARTRNPDPLNLFIVGFRIARCAASGMTERIFQQLIER
jgi:hypothetical protein